MKIRKRHVDHYITHGYAIVENFLTKEELEAIRTELKELLPGWVEFCDDPTLQKPRGWDQDFYFNDSSSTKFPYPGKALNSVVFHPEFRKFAKMMAGGNEVKCDESSLSAKCKGNPRDENQPMHCDFGNHTLAYPPNIPAYWQTTFTVFYTDVDLDHAPTAICPWEHYRDDFVLTRVCPKNERPELYNNEIKATVPAGSVVMYSHRTYHRSTKFNKDVGRLGHWISYSPIEWSWLGHDGFSKYGGNLRGTPDNFHSWMESATPEQRSAIGFPSPDHSYWTKETIAGVSLRYPGMDMTPYEEGIST